MSFRKTMIEGGSVGLVYRLISKTFSDVINYKVHLNNEPLGPKSMHKISSFVEQEDALLGVLTVRESISYALRLQCVFSFVSDINLHINSFKIASLPLLPRNQVNKRVERVIKALGLQSCADQRIGTPISRGISGGQKRRVTAACAMVTFP